MDTASLDDIELAYELHGDGEPVVLVHWGVGAAWAEPLLEAPALAGHRLLNYHRASFGRSGPAPDPVSMAGHAAHCAALMRQLGIERAHVVGHSSSADVALQLALDAPERVASLTLMEPALTAVPSRATWGKAVAVPAVEAYRAGDRARAVDLWMRGVAGDGWREPMDRALPAAFEQAVADAPTFFEQELPAVQSWSFGERDASRIKHPALAVIGARSPEVSPVWAERHALLLAWLPNVVPFVLEHATHLLHVQNPSGMAEALAAHVARHAAATV
jgi:pimeloyl-ACP methyl ester carboxylesterase